MVPEIFEELARRTLNLAKTRFDESHRTLAADRRRLDEARLEQSNLTREMAKLGSSDEFYEVLGELREEKAAIQARIEAGQPEWSPESLEKPVRAAISELESLLMQGAPEKAHLALEKLLRGNRITVHQSPGNRDDHIPHRVPTAPDARLNGVAIGASLCSTVPVTFRPRKRENGRGLTAIVEAVGLAPEVQARLRTCNFEPRISP